MALQPSTASNYPSGFNNITIRGVPITQSHPGQVFWVSNTASPLPGQISGSDGNPGTFNAPFATLQYAISRTVPQRGDIIFIKPGHNESITSNTLNVPGATATANAITHYSSGVAIVGLGTGSNRPTFTFNTAASASIVMGCTPATMTASIATTGVMTVTVLTSGTILTGMNLFGTGIQTGTYITSQLSGTTGGVGTYQVSIAPAATVSSGTVVGALGQDNSFQNILFVSNYADVTSAFTMTAAGYIRDLAIERCEFRDQSSALNFISIFTGAATTANNCNGFTFNNNKIISLGTTAATTAIKFVTAQDRVSINDNAGNWAVLNDTAAMLATGANSITNFEFSRNFINRPNTSTTSGLAISTSGTAWTGQCNDNRIWGLNGTAQIWINTGTKLAFNQNFCTITGAADKSGLINPAAA